MVFDKLAQFKYNVKCDKCELFSEKVGFLGHTVLSAGVVSRGLMLSANDYSQYKKKCSGFLRVGELFLVVY